MTARRLQYTGIALGLAVTTVTAALTLTRGDWLERLALDLRFRYANHIRPDPRILHVDIDDSSIERIGRWPWHRDLVADLIREIDACGAQSIAVDLLLDNEETPRIPDLDKLTPTEIEAINQQNIIHPDDQLAQAIRRSGKVVLSTSFEMRWPGQPLPPGETPIGNLLTQDFSEDETAVAQELGLPPPVIAQQMPRARRSAAMHLAIKTLRKDPATTPEQFVASVLPNLPPRTSTPDSEVLLTAFRNQQSRLVLEEKNPRFPERLAAILPVAEEPIIAPLATLGQASAGIGYVVYLRDSDGKLREMPLLAQYDGHLISQLGFNVACRVLGVTPDNIRRTDDGYLELTGSAPEFNRRVQINDRSAIVIPWTATGRRWRDGKDFRHIPASALLSLAVDRRMLVENNRRIDAAMDDIIKVAKGEFAGAYVAQYEKWLELTREQNRAPTPARARELAELRAQIDAAQTESESVVEARMAEIKGLTPENEKEKVLFAAIQTAESARTGVIPRLRRANAELTKKIEAAAAELSLLLKDKFVFIGYTATAEGDIVPTPIDPVLPGVIVHATILNAFLQNTFIQRPSMFIQLMLIAALGLSATVLTATRGPIVTLLVTLAIMLAYAATNVFALFEGLRFWYLLVAPLAVCLVPWAAVTVYRQLTAERQKRFVQAQLAEFTSPALARRLAENPEAAAALQRVENREVTCFFSDLAGFTTIAEQADSTRVQQVLNTYLDRMSEVLFKYDAFLNKFLGDGIMAFYNPNVNPQPEHARLACEASLDSFEALEKLKAEQGHNDDLYARLKMRIGLASGIGGVGRFGSHRKADYTVIGDVANLAARLESANKAFGSRLLVSGSTRDIVKNLYDWRYLAELQVKGKKQTVPVFELLCRAGQISAEDREYNERFITGVELYKQRKWDEAIVAFMRILSRRMDDPGASAYIDACQEKKLFPPDDDWAGALELKEK